jgi:metal-responsive CopG/Arc/MetJ family transcriptional regulator
VLVSFPSEFLSDVDKLATKEDRTRSELVREALRLYMKQAVKEDTP